MSNLPQYCEPQTQFLIFLSSTFNTCIPTPLALLSTVFGICSILSWLFAQLPQIIKNFQLRSTSGLSILFLGEWLLGDASNLVGGIFTQQATWQVVLASYYCFVDCILVGQWIYYEYFQQGRVVRRLKWWRDSEAPRRRRKKSPPNQYLQPPGSSSSSSGAQPIASKPRKSLLDESIPPGGNSPRPGSPFRSFNFPSNSPSPSPSPFPQASPNRPIMRPPASTSPTPSPRTVLYISMLLCLLSLSSVQASSPYLALDKHKLKDGPKHLFDINPATIGTLFSWLSTFLYLGSRLPQLIHNFTRRSTAGLSPALFIAAFCGNLFYSLAQVSNPSLWHDMPPHGGFGWNGDEPSDRNKWALRAMPFFLGAAGVLLMDAGMGVQFMLWGEGKPDGPGAPTADVLVVEEDGVRGPGRWKRVQGWMRGWMPVAGSGLRTKKVVGMEYETDTEADTDTESLLGDASSIRSYGGV